MQMQGPGNPHPPTDYVITTKNEEAQLLPSYLPKSQKPVQEMKSPPDAFGRRHRAGGL